MEAINSEKTWHKIKDLLRFKLCNANIHTYTLNFMDMQQWRKESLAAYVHQFKLKPNDVILWMILPSWDIHQWPTEYPQLSSKNLWKGSTNTKGSHYKGRESQCSTTAYCNNHSIFNGQHNVKWRGQMFSMPRTWTHHAMLPSHQMLWMWWIWTYYHRLPSQNSPFRNTGTTSQGHTETAAPVSSRHQWEDWQRRDRSWLQSRYNRHCSYSHHDLHRGHSRSWQWDGHSGYRSNSWWSHSAHWWHSCRPCYDTPHQPHCKSSSHCSSSGYCSHNNNRWHSHPSYRSFKL